jgi:hypothetical protein
MKKLFPTIHKQGPRYIVNTRVWWFFERGTDTHRLSSWPYIHLLAGSQNIQIKKIKEPVKELTILCWFFRENHQFFEVFGKTEINEFFHFEFFFQNQNRRWYFQNSKNRPNTGKIHIHSSKHWVSKANNALGRGHYSRVRTCCKRPLLSAGRPNSGNHFIQRPYPLVKKSSMDEIKQLRCRINS